MGLLQLIPNLRAFRAALPEMFRMMRESRTFVRSISPTMYWTGWIGSAVSGLMGLGAFSAIGLGMRWFSTDLVEKYLQPGRVSAELITVAIAVVVLGYVLRLLVRAAGERQLPPRSARAARRLHRADHDVRRRAVGGHAAQRRLQRE